MLGRLFESKRTVTQFFCQTCNTYWEIPLNSARKLASKAGIDFSGKNFGKYFFLVSGCEECGKKEGQVILQKISDLPRPIKLEQKFFYKNQRT